MAKKIKIKPSWDYLTKCSTEALNAGLTYGKYMARKYDAERKQYEVQERLFRKHREQQKAKQHCKYCGGLIPEGASTAISAAMTAKEVGAKSEGCGRERRVQGQRTNLPILRKAADWETKTILQRFMQIQSQTGGKTAET